MTEPQNFDVSPSVVMTVNKRYMQKTLAWQEDLGFSSSSAIHTHTHTTYLVTLNNSNFSELQFSLSHIFINIVVFTSNIVLTLE